MIPLLGQASSVFTLCASTATTVYDLLCKSSDTANSYSQHDTVVSKLESVCCFSHNNVKETADKISPDCQHWRHWRRNCYSQYDAHSGHSFHKSNNTQSAQIVPSLNRCHHLECNYHLNSMLVSKSCSPDKQHNLLTSSRNLKFSAEKSSDSIVLLHQDACKPSLISFSPQNTEWNCCCCRCNNDTLSTSNRFHYHANRQNNDSNRQCKHRDVNQNSFTQYMAVKRIPQSITYFHLRNNSNQESCDTSDKCFQFRQLLNGYYKIKKTCDKSIKNILVLLSLLIIQLLLLLRSTKRSTGNSRPYQVTLNLVEILLNFVLKVYIVT